MIGKYWYHSDSADFDASNPGFEIAEEAPARTVRIGSVSLQGGTLVTDAPVVVSNLVVDAVSGGTLNGFAFAGSGTLTVKNFTDDGNDNVALPVGFVNCTGLNGVSRWTLSLEGTSKKKRIRTSGGVIRICPPGFVVDFR